jgi:cell fate (sporulation/competence/biofilm development) regulator YlbF (YheA/YmcA/DUF963 family)
MPLLSAHRAVVKAMKNTAALPLVLHQATENLIENLLASEVFLVYQQSLATMNSDSEARGLLDLQSTLQAALRHKQNTNSVTRTDIEELHTIQEQVQANAVIMTYAHDQQGAINFLRQINLEISQTLGMDFAVLAKQTTC